MRQQNNKRSIFVERKTKINMIIALHRRTIVRTNFGRLTLRWHFCLLCFLALMHITCNNTSKLIQILASICIHIQNLNIVEPSYPTCSPQAKSGTVVLLTTGMTVTQRYLGLNLSWNYLDTSLLEQRVREREKEKRSSRCERARRSKRNLAV